MSGPQTKINVLDLQTDENESASSIQTKTDKSVFLYDSPQHNWALPFFTMWTGQSLSLLGSSVARFAIIWWITIQTGSATTLTTLALFAYLPQIFLGPFAGALVDRWDRRWVMIISDGVGALGAAILGYLFWSGHLAIWHIYVMTFVSGLSSIFHFSAMMATTSLMVPKQHLTRVQGANQMIQGLLSVAGPPLGSLALSMLLLPMIMVIEVATAAFAIIILFFIRIPQLTDAGNTAQSVSTVLQDVRAGITYIWAWTGLLLLICFGIVFNMIVSPLLTIIPILVTGHFGGKAIHLAWMETAFGGGILAGGLLLGLWGGFERKAFMLPIGLAGMGIGIVIIGFSPSSAFWLAWGGLLFFGIMNSLLNGSFMVLIQTVVAPDMQGRVFTVMMSSVQAAVPLGLLMLGPIVGAVGVSSWFVMAGVLMLGMGMMIPFVRPIMALDDGHN